MDFWENDIILESQTGSRLFGTNIATSDYDRMGVAIESVPYVLGLRNFETHQDQKVANKEEDRTIYGLKFYLRKVAEGNPTMLELLFAPEELRTVDTKWASSLRELRSEFRTKATINRFLGYLGAQMIRFEKSLKGEVAPGRDELVEKYGMDTKFMAHAVRLGIEGLEFASTGFITLPLSSTNVEWLLRIRNGEMTPNAFFTCVEEYKENIRMQKEGLPEKPNFLKLESFLISTYKEYWKW